jgi:hypothetical protein
MSRQLYKYFMIPFASVPQNPTYKVWFSTWMPKRSEYIWSESRPDPATTTTTWVVGATDDSDLPVDATGIIANSVKCIPPPILASPTDIKNANDFRTAVTAKLTQSLEGIRSS